MRKITDKDVWTLIEQTERSGMLDPPVGFQNEVLFKIRQKQKRKKDMQLFSYSAKVFITMAATLFILFSVPATIHPEEWISEQLMTGRTDVMEITDDKATGAIRTADAGLTENERSGTAQEKWTSDADRFLSRLSLTLDQYCSKVNDGLDRMVKRRK